MSGPGGAAVLGGGSWGTTIAHVLASNGQGCRLWLRDRQVAGAIGTQQENPRYLPGERLAVGIRPVTSIQEAVEGASIVFVAVPARSFREVCRAAGRHLAGDQAAVACTKGLEPGTHLRMTEILRAETCLRLVGGLGGPTLAIEVVRGQPSACVVASPFDEVIRRTSRVLMNERLRVYGNRDLVGVEVCGAVKNVIAIAAGMARGFGFGANTLSLLITRGLAEIRRYAVAQGADPHTMSGLAGVGDLVVTCSSPLSRNNQVGYRLARGEALPAILADMRQVAEGVPTTAVVHEHAEALGIEAPITSGLHRILTEGADPAAAVSDLMSRRARYEIDQVTGT